MRRTLLTAITPVPLSFLLLAVSLTAFSTQNRKHGALFIERGTKVFTGQVVPHISTGYGFRAKAGQRLKIRLKTEEAGAASFTLLSGRLRLGENEEDRVYADSAVKVREWEDEIRKTGDYTVKVDADGTGAARYILEITAQ